MSDLVFTKGSTPLPPPAGTASIYAKPDGLFYTQDESGVETTLKGATGATGATGSPGSSGANGLDGKTVRNGSGAPSSGLGVDGDFYVDTTAHAIYGPKTSGAWGSSTPLVGPAGSNGTNGTNGTNGQGVPTGGTTGQVLKKNSNSDFDTVWGTGGGGGGGTWGSITGTLSDQTDLNTALSGKVPTTTTVNGHALSGNVTVTNADLGAVPTTTTVNGHALSSNVTVTASDVGAVPTTTTVNGHALSSNVVVSASDLTTGTLPHAQLPTLLSGDIPNNAANTSGTATNATNTLVTVSSGNTNYPIVLAPTTSTGQQSLLMDTDITYNPSTDVLQLPATGTTNAGNMNMSLFVGYGVSTVTAAGTTQGTATATTTSEVNISSGVANAGVILPSSPTTVGLTVTYTNNTGNTLFVYPPSGGTIDGQAANASITLPGGQSVSLTLFAAGSWYSTGNVLFGGTGIALTHGSGGISVNLNTPVSTGNGGTGVASVTTTPAASAFAGWDANKNISANNLLDGFTTTATAAGTTTLTVSSTGIQNFTGSTTQTCVLPVVTTLVNGQQYIITNQSTGVVTVNTSGSNAIQAMAANTQLTVTCVNTAGGTGTASWTWVYGPIASAALPIAIGGTAKTSVTTAAAASSWAGWDANKNMSSNNFIEGYTTTATAAGTTTLLVGSTFYQYFTGATTQTVVLPVATTLVNGQQYQIVNNSSGVVTVQTSGLNTVQAMAANTVLTVTCINTGGGTGTASWNWVYSPSGATPISLGGTGQTTAQAAIKALTTWVTGQSYAVGQEVMVGDYFYVCIVAHTASATIAADIALGRWATANNACLPNRNLVITGGDFEDNTVGGWAGTGCATITNGLPVTVGSGGNPFSSANGGRALGANTTAAAVTSSSPIDGLYSLNLATSGAGTIGDGYISQSIPVSSAFQAKALTVTFKYKLVSGTTPNFSGTSSNTYACAIYDVTNNAWIGMAGNFNFVQSSGVGDFVGTFQTASNTAAIQIFVYSPVAPVGASSLLLDNFYVGQQQTQKGSFVSDFVSYTPTILGYGTPTGVGAQWKRVGDSLIIQGIFTAGTSTATTGSFSFPAGLVANVSVNQLAGLVVQSIAGTASYNLVVTSASSVLNFSIESAGGAPLTPQPGNGTFLSGTTVSFTSHPIPIVGWSGNSVMSADSNTRLIAMSYTSNNTPAIGTSLAALAFNTLLFDTTGSYSGSSYTAPVTGTYNVSCLVTTASVTLSTAQACNIQVYKNGAFYKDLSVTVGTGGNQAYRIGGSCLVPCVAGDTIAIWASSSVATTAFGTLGYSHLDINLLTSPAVIAASESIAASYYQSSGTAVTATYNDLIYQTKLVDTHGMVNTGTGVITIPASGIFELLVDEFFPSSATSPEQYNLRVNINGATTDLDIYTTVSATASYPALHGSLLTRLNAGDLVKFQGAAPTKTTSNTAGLNKFSIRRVGI